MEQQIDRVPTLAELDAMRDKIIGDLVQDVMDLQLLVSGLFEAVVIISQEYSANDRAAFKYLYQELIKINPKRRLSITEANKKIELLTDRISGLENYISGNLSPSLREIENNLEKNKGTKHKDDI